MKLCKPPINPTIATNNWNHQSRGLCLELEWNFVRIPYQSNYRQYEPSELESLALPATEGNLQLSVMTLMGAENLHYRALGTAMRGERLNSAGSVVKGAKTTT